MTAFPINALTYNAWVAQIAVLAVVDVTTVNGVAQFSDAGLQTAAPAILDYAELRLQRDLALNALQTYSTAYTFTSGSNVFTIPEADFVTIETISINGAPLTPVSKEWLQNVYGTSTGSGVPTHFANYGGDQANAGQNSNNFLVGPWPDSNYPAAVTGTQRMPSLYLQATQANAGTATTWISAWLPDLLIMASMIYVSARQRDFSAMANDPDMPVNYEAQYRTLLTGAQTEEARKNFAASAWSSMPAPAGATPGR